MINLDMLSDIAQALKTNGAGILVLLAIIILGLIRVMNDASNPIEWWQFIAARGRDGKQYADATKFGIMVGILASTSMVGIVAWKGELTKNSGPWVFGLWLLFIGGTEAFSKWFRALLDKRYGNTNESLPTGGPDGNPDKPASN